MNEDENDIHFTSVTHAMTFMEYMEIPPAELRTFFHWKIHALQKEIDEKYEGVTRKTMIVRLVYEVIHDGKLKEG